MKKGGGGEVVDDCCCSSSAVGAMAVMSPGQQQSERSGCSEVRRGGSSRVWWMVDNPRPKARNAVAHDRGIPNSADGQCGSGRRRTVVDDSEHGVGVLVDC